MPEGLGDHGSLAKGVMAPMTEVLGFLRLHRVPAALGAGQEIPTCLLFFLRAEQHIFQRSDSRGTRYVSRLLQCEGQESTGVGLGARQGELSGVCLDGRKCHESCIPGEKNTSSEGKCLNPFTLLQ